LIAKITRGGSFQGAAHYVLDERRGLDRDHQPEIVGGNMAGRTSAEPSGDTSKPATRGRVKTGHHGRGGPRQVVASIAAAVPSPLDGSAGAGCGRRRPSAGVQGAVGARPFARP
jgi:hypothetical protein